MNMTYAEATIETLELIWDKNILDNPDDPRWIRWKQQFIDYNTGGMAKTFMVLDDGDPVGEGTLLFSQDCKAVAGRPLLANEKTANINANTRINGTVITTYSKVTFRASRHRVSAKILT